MGDIDAQRDPMNFSREILTIFQEDIKNKPEAGYLSFSDGSPPLPHYKRKSNFSGWYLGEVLNNLQSRSFLYIFKNKIFNL